MPKQLYKTAVPDISEEGPTQPQPGPEDHSVQASAPFATPDSNHLFEDLYAAFFFAKCLSALCKTRESRGKTASESNLSIIKTWDDSKMMKSGFAAHKVSLKGKYTSAFRFFSFEVKPLLFSILCMLIYKYKCFHVQISVFGTHREA